MKKRFFIPLLLSLTLQAALLQCQQLTVQPEVGKQTVLSRADIEALPHFENCGCELTISVEIKNRSRFAVPLEEKD